MLNIAAIGGLHYLYALALALALFPLRIFHAALGGILAVAGYAMVHLANRVGWPVPVAVGVGVLLAVLVGWIVELLVYRPLQARRSSLLAVAISSFAAYQVLVNLLALRFGSQSAVVEGQQHSLLCAHVVVTVPQLAMVATSVVVFLITLFLLHSPYGRAVRAMEDSPDLLRACGWNVAHIRTACILSSSAIGGIAGCLSALDTGIEPGMGMSGLLGALVVVVAAGPGSYKGLLLVAILLAALQQVFGYFVSPRWESAASFAVLTAFLVFRPTGLFAPHRRVEEVV